MVNKRRWGIVDPSFLRRSWRTTPPPPLLWLRHHLTTQTSKSNYITRCFQGETLEKPNSDQIEVCLVCASRSTCVVYTAMLCSYNALRLNRPPGKGEFVFFIPSSGAAVTDTPPTGVLSTDRSSCVASRLGTRHHYSLLSHAPLPLPWDLSAGMFSPPAHLRLTVPAHRGDCHTNLHCCRQEDSGWKMMGRKTPLTSAAALNLNGSVSVWTLKSSVKICLMQHKKIHVPFSRHFLNTCNLCLNLGRRWYGAGIPFGRGD